MSHPNFLPAEFRREFRASPVFVLPRFSFTFRASWLKKVFALSFLTLFFVFAYFAYPLGDAIYRVARLYPLMLESRTSAYRGDLKSLYNNTELASHHLKEITEDTSVFSKVGFLPKVGPKIKALHYTIAGSSSLLDTFLPV